MKKSKVKREPSEEIDLLDTMLASLVELLEEKGVLTQEEYEKPRAEMTLNAINAKEVSLDDKKLFDLFIGKRVLKKQLLKSGEKGVPVYSANVFKPLGLIKQTNVKDFSHPMILWGIDGNFELRNNSDGEDFATTDHCGTIRILNKAIVPDYLLYALTLKKEEETFDRSFRASLANMYRLSVKIPVQSDGSFDIKTQREVADRFMMVQQKKEKLQMAKLELDALLKGYIGK